MDPRPWLLRNVMARYWLVRRGTLLGVRGLVVEDGRVLLVRHTYVAGWHLPGGGVEPGEAVATALARELAEEAGVRPTAPPVLLGLYHHPQFSPRDHVALYRVPSFVRDDAAPQPGYEIAERGFFPLDALPDGASDASRRRLAEVFAGAAPSTVW
jgi:ADP-ribose pyrophosphatase YjhB (NUDIX family)